MYSPLVIVGIETKQDLPKKSKNNKRFVDGALSFAQSGCQTNRIIDLVSRRPTNVFEGAYASEYCWLTAAADFDSRGGLLGGFISNSVSICLSLFLGLG